MSKTETKGAGYTTPKGVDERVIPWEETNFDEETIERMKAKNIHLQLWNGFRMIVGGEAGSYNMDFFNEISRKINNQESIIALISGKPGSGKTYCGLRLGQMIDKKFDPKTQIAFTREHLMHLFGPLSPLKRAQVILIDEAHYLVGARDWYESVQKDLMNSLAAIRSKGFIILIVALHRDMLDKVIRKYVLSYHLHMESRGVSTIYRLTTPRFESEVYKKKLGELTMSLPDIEYCNHPTCLGCEYLDPEKRPSRKNPDNHKCYTLRAVYERMKEDFLNTKSIEAQERQEDKNKQLGLPSMRKLIPMLYEKRDMLELNRLGNFSHISIMQAVDELGWLVKRQKAIDIGQLLMGKHPELREELKDLSK